MIINLKIEEYIYNFFFIFFCIYLKVHCQSCQNNPLSTDPFSSIIGPLSIVDIFGFALCHCSSSIWACDSDLLNENIICSTVPVLICFSLLVHFHISICLFYNMQPINRILNIISLFCLKL
jgi:hypothetical protein